MKVIKNTLQTTNNDIINFDFKPIDCLCDNCKSTFVIESKQDIKDLQGDYGWSGILNVTCPCCGEKTDVDYSMKLTKNNIEYPKHFTFLNKERHTVHIKDEEIQRKVREFIGKLEKSDMDFLYTEYGDMFLIVFKEDDGYYAVVTNDYKNCYVD